MNHDHHHHIEFTIETVTTPGSTMYVLRNLQKYTWYEMRIQPFYYTVEGQESNTVRVRTFEDGKNRMRVWGWEGGGGDNI